MNTGRPIYPKATKYDSLFGGSLVPKYPDIDFQPLIDRIRIGNYLEGWADTFQGRCERTGTERYKQALITYAETIDQGRTEHTAIRKALQIPKPPMPGEHVHWTAINGAKTEKELDEIYISVLSLQVGESSEE